MTTQQAGGALLSPPDERDHNLLDYLPPAGAAGLPSEYAYQPLDILSQGQVQSCVAHAVRTIKEWQERQERGKVQSWSNQYIYHNRAANNHQGPGMYAREALAKLLHDGVCPYRSLPGNSEYNQRTSRQMITDQLRQEAADQRIESYARVPLARQDEIKRALILNGPLLAIIPISPALNTCRDDYVRYDRNTGTYHAVVVLGYRTADNGRLEYRIQNSWGAHWGAKGCAWMSDDYPISELWAVVDAYLPPLDVRQEITFAIGSEIYTINGHKYVMDTVPTIRDGRTYLPLRYVGQALGCGVNWIPELNRADLFDADLGYVHYYVGKPLVTVRGQSRPLDTAPYIDGSGRTMIPLRSIGEALDREVNWDNETKTVTIIGGGN